MKRVRDTPQSIVYCADCIVRYQGGLVVVERLENAMRSLALPGGKQERETTGISHEPLSVTALRELTEETGLTGTIVGTLGTYADDGRDPRGQFISTVFVVDAVGDLLAEERKTNPLKLTRALARLRYADFAFDHGQIMMDYLRLEKSFFP